ncbi:MAG: DUF3848 domain-containing protein [Defluviitaleaceae bacterium]|nr:DUF3848 domain-containing protein [Defluviitaleaceae bacterium]
MNTSTTIHGEVKPGDWVISAGNNDYAYLIGEVKEILKYGTAEHADETDNTTDSVHVDFTAFDYPPERIAEIEAYFSDLYGEEKILDEIALDDVIMAPRMLINITRLGHDEITRLGNLRQNCESFCNSFPGSAHPAVGDYWTLIDRLDKNLADYHTMLMGFDKQTIIDMANKISAMSNVHLYMTSRYHFDEDKLDFFLKFKNPLEVVANAWVDSNIDIGDISFALYDVYDKQYALEDYPLVGDASETETAEVSQDHEPLGHESVKLTAQERLYNKMYKEYDSFLGHLKQLPPGEIIKHSHEVVFKESLLICIETGNLGNDEAEALLNFEEPLESLHSAWFNYDETYMDTLRDCIDDQASALLKEKIFDKPMEFRNPPEQAAEKSASNEKTASSAKSVSIEKPKQSLTEKLQAANEKVKEQDALNAGKSKSKSTSLEWDT